MNIKINGKDMLVKKNITLFDLVKEQNLNKEKVVIEHNGEIVDKEKLVDVRLFESDSLEIISFVGGG